MKFLSSEKLSAHKYKTPEGYLICTDAILARTGKQTYRRCEVFADSNDESEIEIDRKAEEVFAPATLASFENKPITVEHPDENVTPDNYNDLSVGFVRDVRRGEVDGQEVMLGTLVITDGQTIEEIENGEHTDLSCGYDCDIVDEANPQQRNIRGNHVALCECGRAGIARIVDSVKDASYSAGDFITYNGKTAIITSKTSNKVTIEGYPGPKGFRVWFTIDEFEEAIKQGKIVTDSIKDSVKDAKFVVYNDDDDSFGKFATKEEAQNKIKELKAFDKRNGNPFEEHYRIEIEDAKCKDDIIFNYTEEDLKRAQEMLEKAEKESDKKLLSTLVEKIKFELQSRKMSDSKCNDAYYLVGGYSSPSDYMLKQDKQHCRARGLKTSVEEIDGSWQLIIEGPRDKVKDIVENYFAGDVSSIGDAVKDARRLNYDDDIIKVYLNGKEVFRGYAEDWIDESFDDNFKWTGTQYEATNSKGKWVVKVVDSVKDAMTKAENVGKFTLWKDEEGNYYLDATISRSGKTLRRLNTKDINEARNKAQAMLDFVDDSIRDANKDVSDIISYFNAWGYPLRSELQQVVDYYQMSKEDVKKVFGSTSKYSKADLDNLKCYDSVKDAYYTESERNDKTFVKNAIEEMTRYINNWSYLSTKQKQDIGCSLEELKARVKELKESVKDSKYTIKYVDNNVTYIKTVKAKSTLDALKKFKK